MSGSVKNITGQVEVIYDKAISEIDQEEAQLDDQIRLLENKRNALDQKRQHIDQLRHHVEQLTVEIAEAEERHGNVVGRKAEIEAEIERLKSALEQNDIEIQNAKQVKMGKYQELAEIVERFSEIKDKLPGELVEGLEQSAQGEEIQETSDSAEFDHFDAQLKEELSTAEPSRQKPAKPKRADQSIDSIGMDDLDLQTEESIEPLDEETIIEDEIVFEAEEVEFEDEDQDETSLSGEAAQLRDSLGFSDDDESETAEDDLDLDWDEEEIDEAESGLSDLFDQVELDGRETEEERLALERGELSDDDDDEDEELLSDEELTPKNARTSRKKRQILDKYLDETQK